MSPRLKKTIGLLAGAVVTAASCSTLALASTTTNSRGSLVAFGDSISFGYNLSDTQANTVPSQCAFPALVSKKLGLSALNYAVPSEESQDIPELLKQPQVMRSVKTSSVVVLDIGSNDLLHYASESGMLQASLSGQPITITPVEQQQFLNLISQFKMNLAASVSQIRQLTNAPIVFVNLYDPFPDQSTIHPYAEKFETLMNQIIESTAKATPDSTYADVHSVFDHHQDTYVRVAENDVHPTLAGQSVLAQTVLAALKCVTLKSMAGTPSVESMVGSLPVTGGTVTGAAGSDRVTLTVPNNSPSSNSTVLITSQAKTGWENFVPKGDQGISEFGINFWQGLSFHQPFQVTITGKDIPKDAVLVQILGNGTTTFVPKVSIQAGKITFFAQSAGDYVLVSPIHTTVPSHTEVKTGLPVGLILGISGILLAVGSSLLLFGRKSRLV